MASAHSHEQGQACHFADEYSSIFLQSQASPGQSQDWNPWIGSSEMPMPSDAPLDTVTQPVLAKCGKNEY